MHIPLYIHLKKKPISISIRQSILLNPLKSYFFVSYCIQVKSILGQNHSLQFAFLNTVFFRYTRPTNPTTSKVNSLVITPRWVAIHANWRWMLKNIMSGVNVSNIRVPAERIAAFILVIIPARKFWTIVRNIFFFSSRQWLIGWLRHERRYTRPIRHW